MEIIILFIIIVGFSLLYFKKKDKDNTSQELLIQLNNSLRQEIQEIRKEVGENSEKSRQEIEKKLTDINKGIYAYQENSKEDMQKQFASSNKVIKEVTSELEKIKGTNEQVLGFANQMKTLEKILSNQKQRGILGEIQLENLLSNVLPPELFSMQYSFSNGEQVDAIVKVGEYIIPIDAKFSLDNYNKMIESEDKLEIENLEKVFKEDIKKSRKLLFETNIVDVQLMLIRGSDVPTYVEFGAADMGVVGKDLILEYGCTGVFYHSTCLASHFADCYRSVN